MTSGIPSGEAIANNVTVDYAKVGTCNSTILARVGTFFRRMSVAVRSILGILGDFCDYIVTITIPPSGGSVSTDLSVEIIMPDENTTVMQMSKPQITYVGGNFASASTLYNTPIVMTSQQNNTQVRRFLTRATST